MKFILLVVTALFILGCGDSKEESKAVKPTPVVVEKETPPPVQEEPKVQTPAPTLTKAEPAPKPVATIDATINKCAGCHGKMGEKSALNKSKIINTMSADAIYTSLKGYQDGSYGGDMKTLMKGQIAGVSDEDLKKLAEHFGK